MKSKMLISLFLAFAMTHTIPLALAAINTPRSNDLDMDFEDDIEQGRDQIVNQLSGGLKSTSGMAPGKQDQLSNQSVPGVGVNGRNPIQTQSQKAMSGQRVAGNINGALGSRQEPSGQRMQASTTGSRGRLPNVRASENQTSGLAQSYGNGPKDAGRNFQAGENQITGLAQPYGNNLKDAAQNFQSPSSTFTNPSNIANNIPGGNQLSSRLPPSAQFDIDNNNVLGGLDQFKNMSQSLALPNIVSAASTELPSQVANRIQQLLQQASTLLSQYLPELGQALNALSFGIANPQLMQTLKSAFMEGYDGIQEITNLGIGSFFDIVEQVLGVALQTVGTLIETSADGISAFTKPGKRFAAFAGDIATRSTSNIPILGTAVQAGSGFANNSLDMIDSIGTNSWRNFGTDIRKRGQQGFINGDMNNQERFQQRLQRGGRVNRMPNNPWMNQTNMNQEIPVYA